MLCESSAPKAGISDPESQGRAPDQEENTRRLTCRIEEISLRLWGVRQREVSARGRASCWGTIGTQGSIRCRQTGQDGRYSCALRDSRSDRHPPGYGLCRGWLSRRLDPGDLSASKLWMHAALMLLL